jgi:ATP-binding cassette subfamily B protein
MFRSFASLIPYLGRYALFYWAGLGCLLITNTGQLLIPQWLKAAVNHISRGLPPGSTIVGIVAGMVATSLVVALARVGWRFFLTGASRRIEAELRQALMDHLLTLPPSYFARQKTGDLMARATNDLEAVRNSIGMALVALTDAIFLSGSILVILFVQNPLLGLLIVSPLPIITVLILIFGRLVRTRFKKVQEEYSALSNFVQENLAGNRVVKAFTQEANADKKFLEANRNYREANMKLVTLWGFFFPLITALAGLSGLMLLYFGGKSVMDGTLSPGDFTAYLSYIGMLVWPLMGAGMVVNMLQRGAASLKRIDEILKTEPEIRSPESGALPPPQRFDIRLNNLSFRYSPEGPLVLEGLDLEIPEGTLLGVLGRLGSGKSTLAAILPRLYDPPPGSVLLGGRDIRDYELTGLRRSFSMVPQTTFLFSDSMKNNIAFSDPNADESKLRQMAELSTISRDMDTFTRGWETEVGERGVSLSGGQKQRLSLSRALTAEAPILILDDALSAVDVETEEKIIRHLQDARKGRTNILISHRVNTLRHCSRIIVLDAGRIVQQGTHEELMGQEGLYSEIALMQHVEAR